MTKRTNSKYKISRRFGVNLWGREKDPYNTKNYAPGQHGQTSRKVPSDYANQLKAKQLLKGYYGNISERQFFKTFQEASRVRGNTAEKLIGLLESRLDAVVYRLNFVATIFAARQFVSHKHIKVNGKTVNIPSYTVKEGDVIEVKEKSKNITNVIEYTQAPEREVPGYLESDLKAMKGKFVRVPKLDEVPYPIKMEPNLVTEFYSR